MEMLDPERMSSGAWLAAEQRAKQRGRPMSRRASTAEFSGLQAQVGLPNRIERLIRIEREIERMEQRLRGEWLQHAERAAGDAEAFALAWTRRLRHVSFLEVNELVDEHNEWFPIEAQLPWNLQLQDYRAPFGLPWRKKHIGAAWALQRFPPDLGIAMKA